MNGPLILPKGVIKNSSTINHSIEQFQTSPLDLADIAKLWKVYTTTKRRLCDPTAERLENYWWRIWGSRSRNLKAVTVAQIFADISDGQSFVPLTSQANRDEGTPPASQYRHPRPGASSTTAHRNSTSKLGTTPRQVDPPPSILKNSDSNKKTRGPSQTGPRPTARFISPHESENETSPICSTTQVVVATPSPTIQEPKLDKKLAVPSGKKRAVFVASGRGKRPVAVRRQSSQSSTDGPARAEAQLQSSADRTPPQFTDQAREGVKQRVQSSSQENSSSSSGKTDKKVSLRNARTSEVKQASPRKSALGNRKGSKEESVISEAGPSRQPRMVENNKKIVPEDSTREEMDELELQRLLLAEANARVQQTQRSLSHTTLPSVVSPNQHQTDLRRTSGGAEQLAQQRSKSAVNLAPTSPNGDETFSKLRNGDKGKRQDPKSLPPNGLFSKRPIHPISTAPVPESAGGLNRTKSQLTLLLEKDRAQTNSNSSSRTDLKGKKKG